MSVELLERIARGEQLPREEWLEARKLGVGSSDCPVVCRLDDRWTPLHLYMEKLHDWRRPETLPMAWGRKLEGVVAEAYAERTGRKVFAPFRQIEVHPQLPWLMASLDRITEVDGQPRIVEIKCAHSAGPDWGPDETDVVPMAYMVQVQHQLMVTGYKAVDVAALFGGTDLRVYTIEANEDIQRSIRRMCADFWQMVADRTPPGPLWEHPGTPDLVRKLAAPQTGLTVELGAEQAEQAKRYRDIAQEVKKLKAEQESLAARMMYAMGEAEAAILPSGHTLRRAVRKRRGYTVDPTEYVEFRVKDPKGA